MGTSIINFLARHQVAFTAIMIAFGMALAVVATGSAKTQYTYAHRCKNTNVLRCGVTGSTADSNIASFRNYYNNNTSGHDTPYRDIQTVYNHFNANQNRVNAMNTTNTKRGVVYRDGRVVVDGKTVGTDARVSGRFKTAGSYLIPGTNVYVRKPEASFVNNSQAAIIYFENGKMVFGSLLDCGNPVKATPVERPKPQTKPQEKPQSLACTYLRMNSTNVRNQYKFTARGAAENGATFTSYTFDFGDGSDAVTVASTTRDATTTHTYDEPGNYTAKVTVNGTVNGKATTTSSSQCEVAISISKPQEVTPPPAPEKEVTPPPATPAVKEMPKTGAGSILALFGGTSALGTLAHRWYLKRRMR